MSLYSEIKTSAFMALPIIVNANQLGVYNKAKTIVENVDELILDFSVSVSSVLDYRYQHSQTKYLVKNNHSLEEMKWRIWKYGDIFNFIDFTSQTRDKFFLPRIRNLQKILKKIIAGQTLVWTERNLFLEYTKFPSKCFKCVGYEFQFVPVLIGNDPYTVHSCQYINKHIELRIGVE